MLNKLNSLREREEGFTLIELLIVVIIIGILAAIALPIFIDQQKVAIDASVASDVRNTVTNVTNAQAQNQLGDATVTAPKVAKSSANNDINVVAETGTDKVYAGTSVPVLGSAYTVTGTNVGGKKYTGGAGKVYTFTAADGTFAAK